MRATCGLPIQEFICCVCEAAGAPDPADFDEPPDDRLTVINGDLLCVVHSIYAGLSPAVRRYREIHPS